MALIVISTVACGQDKPSVIKEYTLVGDVYTTSTFTYKGDIKNEAPNGVGTMSFAWGDKYEGEVINANPNGQGVMTYVDGSVYRGHFKDGRPDGQGRMDTPDGGWYEGSWKDGSRNGQGILMFDGIQQTGIFENDQPKKVAILNLSNCLKGDCRSGYGVERTGEGTYSGEFVDGEFHGQGTYKYNNGDGYTGDFVEGKFHGQGTYKYNGGDVYKGGFIKGQKYGYGVITSPSGKYTITGFFEQDKWAEGIKQYKDDRPDFILLRGIR
jgi:hypothetical protein